MNIRWRVCALLFFATTINYIDRQVLGLLAPQLQREFSMSESEYGLIVTAFQAAYALGLAGTGFVLDRIGVKRGFSIAVVVWSIACAAHALARSAFGFGVARFALGLGEAANFPASIKAVAEWFPKKERALATGLFNAGSNIGAIIAPLVVAYIALQFGWQQAFIITGGLGFIWLIFWLYIYERPEAHKTLSREEFAYILADPVETSTSSFSYRELLKHKETWALCAAKFLTDPIWWFFLYWLPKFLNTNHGITLSSVGAPLVTIYTMATLGSVSGGYLSSWLVRKGWNAPKARISSMLVFALCIVPIFFASQTSDLWTAVVLIGIAAAAHQGWSANLFTLISDLYPKSTIGSMTGLAGMSGAIGGMLIASIIGFLLQATGSYVPVFALAASAYLLAWVLIRLLLRNLEPLNFTE
jgi:ACS family hexuronate transporter-like MFS transporter